MRKILLLAATCLLTLSTNAQKVTTLSTSNSLSFEKAPRSTAQVANSPSKAPRKALGANQYLCGFTLTDDLAQYGSGVASLASGVCQVGNIFTSDVYKSFSGFKVVGMRVGLCYDITDFSVVINKISSSGITPFVTKTVGNGQKGWNEVMFDEADQFELTGTDQYLTCYTYNQLQKPDPDYPGYYTDDCYPLSILDGSETLYFYGNIPASAGGSGEGWYTLGSGVLSIQWIVEGELPTQHFTLNALNTSKKFYSSAENLTGTISVSNMGALPITNAAFDFMVDGSVVGNQQMNTNIPSASDAEIPFDISPMSISTAGEHTISVQLTTLNSTTPTGQIDNPTAEGVFYSYYDGDVKPRQKYLVEHFTSHSCTYCPLGYDIMRNLESNHSDIAWVSIHGNQSMTDPLNFAECNQLQNMEGLTGWPGASFNRIYDADMSEGKSTIIYGIGYNSSYTATAANMFYSLLQTKSEPSFVALDIQQAYDSDSRTLDLTVKGEGAPNASILLQDYGLTVYITEAGLTGRQLNMGTWVNEYEHNNALRMVLTAAGGDEISWSSNNFEYTKTVTIPDTYVAENLSITAFVAPRVANINYADIYDMAVNNCEKVALEITDGIQELTGSANTYEVARYAIDGKLIDTPRKGINIVKMSDGTTHKVLVK